MSLAQFVVVPGSDDAFKLPQDGGINDREFPPFDLIGLDRDRTAILMFKLTVRAPGRLMVSINSFELDINYVFDSPQPEPAPRSWHEIIQGSHLKADHNQMTVAVIAPAEVTLSDFIVFYHATS